MSLELRMYSTNSLNMHIKRKENSCTSIHCQIYFPRNNEANYTGFVFWCLLITQVYLLFLWLKRKKFVDHLEMLLEKFSHILKVLPCTQPTYNFEGKKNTPYHESMSSMKMPLWISGKQILLLNEFPMKHCGQRSEGDHLCILGHLHT